ncbi:MAG: HD domain-containing protein [Intestinimonas sp.]|jgi:HD-GYP domain-containing protein (c-di-GMP phosphodiesterase class II)|nr:HD domain-containing protein [Intestinimonas sp.]
MSTENDKYTDIKTIIKLLPRDQIEHMAHVEILVKALASEISGRGLYSKDLKPEKSSDFGKAAFYHDIGKAWVPQRILSKPAKLTGEEMRIARNHTLFADKLFQRILNGSISGMPIHLIGLAHDSAVYHHEWWNGMGYPYGISRFNIPLVARITSICDVYDAITSDRAYRRACSHDYACHEIEKNAGSQFDPALVPIFLNHEAELPNLLLRARRNGLKRGIVWV